MVHFLDFNASPWGSERNYCIVNIRVRSVWFLHGALAAPVSLLTGLTGNSACHWWVEIEAMDSFDFKRLLEIEAEEAEEAAVGGRKSGASSSVAIGDSESDGSRSSSSSSWPSRSISSAVSASGEQAEDDLEPPDTRSASPEPQSVGPPKDPTKSNNKRCRSDLRSSFYIAHFADTKEAGPDSLILQRCSDAAEATALGIAVAWRTLDEEPNITDKCSGRPIPANAPSSSSTAQREPFFRNDDQVCGPPTSASTSPSLESSSAAFTKAPDPLAVTMLDFHNYVEQFPDKFNIVCHNCQTFGDAVAMHFLGKHAAWRPW